MLPFWVGSVSWSLGSFGGVDPGFPCWPSSGQEDSKTQFIVKTRKIFFFMQLGIKMCFWVVFFLLQLVKLRCNFVFKTAKKKSVEKFFS